MTRKIRTSIPQVWREAQAYINQRVLTKASDTAFETTKKPLKKWLKDNGEPDDDGNLQYIFPQPINAIDDKTYVGVELRCSRGQPFMKEDEVRKFVEDLGPRLRDRVIRQVEYVDTDELYVLHQEGEITEQQLRDLLHMPAPSYALWPIEAVDVLEEE